MNHKCLVTNLYSKKKKEPETIQKFCLAQKYFLSKAVRLQLEQSTPGSGKLTFPVLLQHLPESNNLD